MIKNIKKTDFLAIVNQVRIITCFVFWWPLLRMLRNAKRTDPGNLSGQMTHKLNQCLRPKDGQVELPHAAAPPLACRQDEGIILGRILRQFADPASVPAGRHFGP